MIDKSVLILLLFWCLHTYGPPSFLFHFIIRVLKLSDDFFILFNKTIYGGYYEDLLEIDN